MSIDSMTHLHVYYFVLLEHSLINRNIALMITIV